MKIDKLKPGQIVYDVGRHKMGNTTLSTVAVWSVRIVSVAEDGRSVVASWNNNKPHTYYARDVAKWRLSEPVLIKSGWGHRLATREELKALREAEKDEA